MKELAQILHILRTTTTPSVLATLVKVEGSSYRRVGARLLWSPEEKRFGSISGGCLEEDLIERARQVWRSGESQTVIYDTTAENDLVWGVGLGCHGVVRVLLERLERLPSSWEFAQAAWSRRQPVVAASVYETSAALAGGLLGIFTHSGDCGAASANAELRREAAAALEAGRSRHVRIQDAEVFLEHIPPPVSLHIYGAGDDAVPLARLASELGWKISVADPRRAFATRERFPIADRVEVITPENLGELAFDPWSVTVVMTHHYRFDLPLLRQLLPYRLPYLGLLGPKKRADRILADLGNSGAVIGADQRIHLHAPVGLDLGGGTPEEVALAIVAEILAVTNARDARPLRERSRPIHE